MDGRQGPRPRSFIVRVLRCDHNDWQGQLVDVASGAIYPFASFLQLQRMLLGLVEHGAFVGAVAPTAAPAPVHAGFDRASA